LALGLVRRGGVHGEWPVKTKRGKGAEFVMKGLSARKNPQSWPHRSVPQKGKKAGPGTVGEVDRTLNNATGSRRPKKTRKDWAG